MHNVFVKNHVNGWGNFLAHALGLFNRRDLQQLVFIG